ncbi:GerAB/ArcD/ProY family transporter [Paenibacillus arenilitoris]|uniref:Endospore germination permease n=1 Tax=Paenibacillus arenilitoris TaxID=2772299 RepID=A0A927CN12_9BACL|nr:endospore germination permease [Paenibacillus arenilitoris]MBD2870282.1 endospore germination permease [Paenibacillus arenilitoris]
MERGNEQIPSTGLAAVMFMFIVGSSLTVPLAAVAGHDAWISILLAIAVSCGIVWVYTTLCQLFPGRSLVEIGSDLFGAWTGRILGLCYAWYSFHLGVLVLRAFTEFIMMVALPKTPPLTVSAAMMAIVLWVTYSGVETVCRCSLAILAFVLLEGIVSMILMGGNFEAGNLLPIIDRGWSPIVQGMTELVGFPFGETILFAMIIPHLNKVGQAKRTVIWTLIAAGSLLLLVNLRNTLVLGELSSRLIYPSYTAYQYISIADFIERVEPIVIVTWVTGVFIKLSVCLYVAANSLSTALAGSRFRTYLVPLTLLMIEFSRLIYRNNTELIQFATNVWQWYSVPFQILVPVLLLLAALFVKRKRNTARRCKEETGSTEAAIE